MELKIGGRYMHYKGKPYRVLAEAIHSETLEKMVVYRQEYGEGSVWVRPKDMFLEEVCVEGNWLPRFRWLEGE